MQSDPSKAFIICAPPYQGNSAGIVVLHELCDTIVRIGYRAHIALMLSTQSGASFQISEDPKYYRKGLLRTTISDTSGSEWLRKVIEHGVVIYPEIISGNPLNARKVVRYFLNKEGAITGRHTQYTPRDFCLAYSQIFFPSPHAVLLKPVTNALFTDAGTKPACERAIDLTYFGKGPKYTACFKVDGSIVLPRTWPETKEELAILLRNSRYVYSWDAVTSLNNDAILCGAIVVLMQFNQMTSQELSESEFGPPPVHKGIVDGTKVSIEKNPDYEHLKDSFLRRMSYFADNWDSNVEATIQKIFNHFRAGV